MKRLFAVVVILAATLISLGANAFQSTSKLQANPALPPVTIPPDNPQTESKVALGRQLYFDSRLSADNTISCATCHDPQMALSADNTISCATCHDPQMAWANHNPVDIGIDGRKGTRNSGTILDAAYMDFQFWDGRARTLEGQALGPIHNPVEMGETLEHVVAKLSAIDGYRTQFKTVFGTGVTTDGIAKAIAAFERTVLSGASPYDKYRAGDTSAMPEAAVRGLRLFNGKARCRTCHGGPMFSDQGFHNLGVGMDRPQPDIGREAVTKDPKDRGRFKTPGLRNVALTWPYMHDGSVGTLADVVALYDRGGEKNPTLDIMLVPLELTADEQNDLVAFMEALTGSLPTIDRPALPK